MTAAVLLLVLLVGLVAGILLERHRRDTLLDEAANATVDALVARQIADDRAAVLSMPPGVDASDAVAYAAEHGIGVREAALILFRAQARARLAGNIARHRYRPSPNR